MARYRNEDSVLAMFNRFFHLCETKEQKTLVLDMKQAFLEIIPSDATPKSAWISVDERLPEPLVDVLAFDAEGDIFIDFVLKSTGGFVIKGVTHWMPLPEPPKGE